MSHFYIEPNTSHSMGCAQSATKDARLAATTECEQDGALDIGYRGILGHGIPSILNNAAAPTALLLNLAIFSRAGGPEWMAAWAVVQSTVSFGQGLLNFLLYVPMAQIAHAVGQGRAIRARVAWALGTGLVLGVVGTLALCFLILRPQGWACLWLNHVVCSESHTTGGGVVLEVMHVTATVRPLVALYLLGRVPSILLVFVNRVCTGILVGKQRLRLVTLINVMVCLMDVAGNFGVLLWRQGTIFQAGMATSITTVMGIVVILPLSICLKPIGTHQVIEEMTPRIDEEEHPFHVLEFISSSLNMIVRSILLQGAMYSLSILASRIGTAELAAHQVLVQIWSLISFCCDGFADVGTMVGARLLGAGQYHELLTLTNRLLVLAVMAGALCGTLLLLFQQSIMDFFTSHDNANEADLETKQVLQSVWMLTALMQPVNALVFVSDGILFAHQAFGFIRNLMLIGVLGIFLPFLVTGYCMAPTLLVLWIAKSMLSTWRCLAALWFCWRFQKKHCSKENGFVCDNSVPTERIALLP